MKGTISEINFRDEFGVLDQSASISDVAGVLHTNAVKVVLVRSKKQVIGVITQQHFLQVCATGIHPLRTKATDYLQSNLLHLNLETPIPEAIVMIEESEPDAIIVIDSENRARGYLSPADFREMKEIGGDSEDRPTKLAEVMRLIPSLEEKGQGKSMLLPNRRLILAIANRGVEGHGIQQLHLEGARINTEPELLQQNEQNISLWPLNSVDKTASSLCSYLELESGASNDGSLVMLMDMSKAIANLNRETWAELYKSSDEYTGVE